jgi:hypothetical protein
VLAQTRIAACVATILAAACDSRALAPDAGRDDASGDQGHGDLIESRAADLLPDGCSYSCGAVAQRLQVSGDCVLPLPCWMLLEIGRIDVFADGSKIPRDESHVNGWDYADADGTGVKLYGQPCFDALDGTTSDIAITSRCSGR